MNSYQNRQDRSMGRYQNSCRSCHSQGSMPANPARQANHPNQMDSRSTSLCQMNQCQLLTYLNEVSFVVSDMLLYLDTHPNDQTALEFCREHISLRSQALKEYSSRFGPLTIDTADDNASTSWNWVETPWPWEGRLN